MANNLSTEAYKGTRDFYPEDMAIQRYIFDTWAKTAESYGYERYDASILEPSELYKSKGAENEEMINEQTYTFTDRGDREVTLRPEMTPTVARMVAGRRRDLSSPIRWYSIPNLFRYERPQRGRLREHWQLNCDMFGVNDVAADVEMIALAASVLKAFGAKDSDFEIRINDRAWLNEFILSLGLKEQKATDMIALLDRKEKVNDFEKQAEALIGKSLTLPKTPAAGSHLDEVMRALTERGITNIVFSPSTVRGFNYYTGTVFEIFDTDPNNNRSLIGGGRYDNLTGLFGGDPISGIGFGMGDVTMRDFLLTHKLLPDTVGVTSPTLMILPTDVTYNLEAGKIAQKFRENGVRVATDISDKKLAKKLSVASERRCTYVLIVGENEIKSGNFTLKELKTKKEINGTISDLLNQIL